jgi:C-terminal processing protease CtpA/Prc
MLNWFRRRTALGTAMAVALVSCGGGDGGSSGGPIGGGGGGSGGGGGGGAADPCSLASRQQAVRDVIDDFYLFPALVDEGARASDYSTVQDYIDALVAPARAADRDRYFSYITSIEEEERLARGQTAGFGIRLFYDADNKRLFVVEAFENAPAFAVGIDRGTEILSIGGKSVSALFDEGGPFAVSEALGPGDPGVTRQLRFEDTSGIVRDASVTKADYILDPVSDRYGARIIQDGASGRQVGYVNLRTFFSNSAPDQLRAAFASFKAQGIDEIILDLRYNGGGFISVAETLGSLMANGRAGQVFSRTVFRPSRSNLNETTFFGSEPNAVRVKRVAVIATDSTASASELVTNAFLPYLGDDIALIGSDSFGKPVGQEAFDREECDDRLRIVSLQTVNANNEGDYYSGLAEIMPATCRAEDELAAPLGQPGEASVDAALDFLAGRSCTPIVAAGVQTARSVSEGRAALAPRRPSAAQFEIPGLF